MNPSKGMEAAEAEIDRLRASNAALKKEVADLRMQWDKRIESIAEPYMLEARALKAENEALRAQVRSITEEI